MRVFQWSFDLVGLQPELRRGHVHTDLDLTRVACLLDGLDDEVEPLLVLEDVGREAALVAHVARVLAVLGLDHRLEVMVDLGAHLHRLRNEVGANRVRRGARRGGGRCGGGAVAGAGAAARRRRVRRRRVRRRQSFVAARAVLAPR